MAGNEKPPLPVLCLAKQVPWLGINVSSEGQLQLGSISAVEFGGGLVQMLSCSFLTTARLLAARLLTWCLKVSWKWKLHCAFLKGLTVAWHLAGLPATFDIKTLALLQEFS